MAIRLVQRNSLYTAQQPVGRRTSPFFFRHAKLARAEGGGTRQCSRPTPTSPASNAKMAPPLIRRSGVPFLLVLVLVLLANPLFSASIAANEPDEVELRVRPLVCVTLASDSDCEMALRVSWSTPAASDVCVRLEDGETMLRCWQQRRAGEFEMTLQRRDNAIVQLLDSETSVVLDQAEVTVVSRDLRDSRRRRRHVWSII